MIIIPAIDLRNGKCVRLTQGQFDQEIIYEDQPIEVAKQWEAQGAKFLHLVDLDGALIGRSQNSDIIEKIVSSITIPVQVGGGIRKIETVAKMFQVGVNRVILGTSALKKKDFLKEVLEKYEEKILVSIDAKNGYVAWKGWTEVSNVKALEFAKELEDLGVKNIIYTDIAKDGMLLGPNFKEIKILKDNLSIDIIASGGISTKEHLIKLKELDVEGAIIGKALYTGDLKLEEIKEV
ncbi:1-(5-phosphoribosyl)-5-[(5-phosphoribosylamino)methylideneamino]imidazole-4-carboxamide isomerase [Garciella nitratireducens]|uniref:1-(5-phosphoribosyl)-5-[(5-phosphoribosylamino)methylideneamino] imidazole-4-carboxamide isomerase n=1 Tax=Garciella nitratireducens DSM 15102 TaxID=1121911 RepID=A0A1T4KNR8_9FIRM|nr:1-(5-phosphoribosyl)-5-[(5-phosphoribosylamino)methylideneamino]imidazole-4-carboxamide isomerase [Garciella nitratireducens]RBP40275.1 1-(5-phosphoribosyl)-5-[(5-phosphoribosylamino)methylideneamino] imidazole-4-carboxamide isomerase [Garciella nitratireducens]SJZ44008.1 1-(5-phosphoribosyl)-5-[(5-phosphoribosylamino)methylideneamino] imidazole-4-carboxamide isomerase [Garciella nitratireducens DSM 15102]